VEEKVSQEVMKGQQQTLGNTTVSGCNSKVVVSATTSIKIH
jgi:hypothetical protein